MKEAMKYYIVYAISWYLVQKQNVAENDFGWGKTVYSLNVKEWNGYSSKEWKV